jgi:hypothetical protein
MRHNPAELERLGLERQRLVAELNEVSTKLKPLIIAADKAGMQQIEISRKTGYSAETIRQACLTPEQAAAEKEARRQRRRTGQ